MISISNNQKRYKIPPRLVKHATQLALEAVSLPTHDVSICFATPIVSQRLNREYIGHDYPTDVLSFTYGDWPPIEAGPFLGEVVVCPKIAQTESRERRLPFEQELIRYVIHGILHLAGYRDKRVSDRRKMHRLQETILGRVFPVKPKRTHRLRAASR